MINFQCKASGDALDMLMYGPFGEDFRGDGASVDARAVAKALNDNKNAKQINLRINSPGGSAFHGLAIYESLKSHGAKVLAKVDGIAASAATLPLMAADEVEMNSAGLLMIHRSSVAAMGNGSDLRQTAEVADKIDQSMTQIYAAKTGLPEAQIVAMLFAETWMTAEEAKANNFITSISQAKTVAAEFKADQFQDVPERIQPILASLHSKGEIQMSNPVPTVETPKPAETQAPGAIVPKEPAVDVAKVTADASAAAQAAERKRCADIHAACQLAKKPEMASKFIEEGTDVAAVKDRLFTAMCEQLPAASVESPETSPGDKENAKYVAEYKAEPLYAKSMTQDEYVAMRRVDDGLDSLKSGVKAVK